MYDSESTSIEALALLNHIKIDKDVLKSKIGVYNHLGMIHREYNNYDEALKFYNKSLTLVAKSSDSITIINNIANIYLDQKKYDHAISELKNSYKSSLILNNKKQIARALNNLGAAQSKIDAQRPYRISQRL